MGLRLRGWAKKTLAKSYLEQALKIDPKNVAVMVQLANFLAKDNQTREPPLINTKKIVQLDARRLEAWSGLAEILLSANRPGEAEEAVATACRLNQRQAYAWAISAEVRRRLGKTAAARADITHALAMAPNESVYLGCLGKICIALSDNEAAKKALLKCTELDPASADGWADLAYTYTQAGEMKRAESAINKALTIDPKSARLCLLQGDIQKFELHTGAAEKSYRQALSMSPKLALASAKLGELLLEQKKFSDAVTALEKATTIDPGLSSAWLNLGKARDAQGNKVGAKAAFDRAGNARSSASKNNLFEIAYKLDQKGDIKSATRVYTLGLLSRPEDTDVLLEVIYGMRERAAAP